MPLAASFRKKAPSPQQPTQTTKQIVKTTQTVASSTNNCQFSVGDRISLPKSGWNNCGTIRYRGPLKGVPHAHNKIFLGIELDHPNGKNNGSVGGFQVFDCPANCGVFCRPQIVRVAQASTFGSTPAGNVDNKNTKVPSPMPSTKPQRIQRSRPQRPSNEREAVEQRPTRTNMDKDTTTTTTTTTTNNEDVYTPSKIRTNNTTTATSRRRAAAVGSTSTTTSSSASSATKSSKSSHLHRGRRTFDPTLSKIPGVKGLKNLGNTCFVNSVLQNISNLPPVRDYYLQSFVPQTTDTTDTTDTTETKETKRIEGRGALTIEVRNFIRSMWLATDVVLTPKHLFHELCKRVPRFGHRQQQDAVELLRYLFDGLDTEAMKDEQLETKINTIQNDNDNNNNDENNSSGENQAAIIEPLSGPLSPQPCGLAVAKTGLVAEIFSGILCSEISCNHCNKVSRIKERCTLNNQIVVMI